MFRRTIEAGSSSHMLGGFSRCPGERSWAPFLTNLESFDERRMLNNLDHRCSVFLVPAERAELRIRRCLCGDDISAWQRQYGNMGKHYQFPQKWLKVALPDDDDQNV